MTRFIESNTEWEPGYETVERCGKCAGFVNQEQKEKKRYICPNCGPVFEYQGSD